MLAGELRFESLALRMLVGALGGGAPMLASVLFSQCGLLGAFLGFAKLVEVDDVAHA